MVRPAKAAGRLPIALITHGKNPGAAENQALRADLMRPQARDFAARGWLAVVVIRRGYGQSDGFPGVSRGAVLHDLPEQRPRAWLRHRGR